MAFLAGHSMTRSVLAKTLSGTSYAQCPGGLRVDDELEGGGLFDGKVGGPHTVEDPITVCGGAPVHRLAVGPVRRKSSRVRVGGDAVHVRHSMLDGQLCQANCRCVQHLLLPTPVRERLGNSRVPTWLSSAAKATGAHSCGGKLSFKFPRRRPDVRRRPARPLPPAKSGQLISAQMSVCVPTALCKKSPLGVRSTTARPL